MQGKRHLQRMPVWPLLRIGAEYGFHFGDLEVSPQVDIDFVDGEQLFVIGVVFAIEL